MFASQQRPFQDNAHQRGRPAARVAARRQGGSFFSDPGDPRRVFSLGDGLRYEVVR